MDDARIWWSSLLPREPIPVGLEIENREQLGRGALLLQWLVVLLPSSMLGPWTLDMFASDEEEVTADILATSRLFGTAEGVMVAAAILVVDFWFSIISVLLMPLVLPLFGSSCSTPSSPGLSQGIGGSSKEASVFDICIQGEFFCYRRSLLCRDNTEGRVRLH